MYGYMIFGLKDGVPFDSFYVSRKATIAIEAHKREFKLTNDHIEMVIRSNVPYKPGTEKEVIHTNGVEVATKLGFSYARCHNCLDFYREEEIRCVKPFGSAGYQSSCENCIDAEGFKPA